MSTKTKEFYTLQKRWYKKLADEGFHDIEGGMDLTCTKLMTNPGGNSTMMSLNAVHARSGRPMQEHDLNGVAPGSQWESTISDQDITVARREPTGTYIHYAALIASQEYELRRLGEGREASRQRLAWGMHGAGASLREIASACECSVRKICSYVKELQDLIRLAIDMADDS
jgi:hypothetical protein